MIYLVIPMFDCDSPRCPGYLEPEIAFKNRADAEQYVIRKEAECEYSQFIIKPMEVKE